MKKTLFTMLALFVLVAPQASADIGITMTMSMNAGPMVITGEVVTRAKGQKMRADTKVMQQDISIFVDGAAKQVLMVNHLTKEITSADPAAQAAALPATIGDATVSIKPNGETKELMGRICKGYALDVTLPMTMAGETITIRMTGVSWMADSGPGVEEYKAISKVTSELGLSTSFMGQSGGLQSKGFAEMQKALADAGVPMAQEMTMVFEGTGERGAMMAQVGAMTMSTSVTALSTDAIADDVFVPPADYTKK
jgi:hypothetical protein